MRVIGVVVGFGASVVLALAGVGLIFAGAGLIAAGFALSDQGFIKSPGIGFSTTRYAMASSVISITPAGSDWLPPGLGTINLEVTPQGEKPVFIGIGPAADVQHYLDGVGRDEFARQPADGDRLEPRDIDGGAPATLPSKQPFWVLSSEGSGLREITWNLQAGSWAVAILNADASPGIGITARFGADVPLLVPIAGLLIIVGLLLVLAAAVSIVWMVEAAGPQPAGVPAGQSRTRAGNVYPVSLAGHPDRDLSRWLWLVKWLLVIPHLIVLAFLWAAFWIAAVIAFFAILFSGQYPRGLFDFNVGVLRWTWRVAFYAFNPAATDRYPPFSLGAADYPAELDVEYPSHLSRGLIFVKWLLAIPHLIIVGVFANGLIWWARDPGSSDGALRVGGGLIAILVLVALVGLLIRGHYPAGLFNLVMGLNRWVIRVVAYVALMRDEYPPFRLDLGGDEPPVEAVMAGPLPGPVPA